MMIIVSCGKPPEIIAAGSTTSGIETNQRTFQVKGVIKSLNSDGKTVEIRHEEVPNYMPAMTMPFEAKRPTELAGLKTGDSVSFRMTVTTNDVWIDQIKLLTPANANEPPTRGVFRRVRDVDPLTLGDSLPPYNFTNELGKAVSTTQLKGQALAITFVFTRCPLPNFCPLMSSNLEEVQKKLKAMPNAPTNWHLLTISFDPDFDTPEILKSYAQRFEADPKHWDFLTGDLVEITAISEQFGQMFWREEGSLSHNLRTVVIDAAGRVQRILEGNKWTSDELVEELIKGAAKK